MRSRARYEPYVIAAAVAVATTCCGDEIVVEARPSGGALDGIGCPPAPPEAQLSSLLVEVLEWSGWGVESVISSECIVRSESVPLDDIVDTETLIAWFDARGYIADDIPAASETIVRIRGYTTLGRCPSGPVPPAFCTMSAVSQTAPFEPAVLSASTPAGESIPLSTACNPLVIGGVPESCSDEVNQAGDGVCGLNETAESTPEDCGDQPDLCRWYRACQYLVLPGR
jgi:hypothetical protein